MIRLGLCCIFKDQPIRFRRTTAKYLGRFDREDQLARLADIISHNATSLSHALAYCADNGIQAFRINSQILPLKTHSVMGYRMDDLPGSRAILEQFRACGQFAATRNIRLSFHPDQFVLLSSPTSRVTLHSVNELIYQAEVAKWVGADVINIHGGGMYGDKTGALGRLEEEILALPGHIRSLLTLENDDRIYTPADLLPVCTRTGIPLVYDVHHHRVNPDGMSIEAATSAAVTTWNREPLFHISSPINGWQGNDTRKHHDYIDPDDFPPCWRNLDITVDVEAKAKELAVLRLKDDLGSA